MLTAAVFSELFPYVDCEADDQLISHSFINLHYASELHVVLPGVRPGCYHIPSHVPGHFVSTPTCMWAEIVPGLVAGAGVLTGLATKCQLLKSIRQAEEPI